MPFKNFKRQTSFLRSSLFDDTPREKRGRERHSVNSTFENLKREVLNVKLSA